MFRAKVCAVLVFMCCSSPGSAQEVVNPIVKNFGGIWEMPTASERPSDSLQYCIVIDVKTGPNEPDQINPALNNIARMLNLHAVGGVPKENLKVVAVIHSMATPIIADNELYNKRFGGDNPNLKLIDELTNAGVKLFVCGQSMQARDYPMEHLNPKIQQSVSALTVLTTYQLKGYALLTF